MKKICVILTCFNRGRLTENCIRTIAETNTENTYSFVAVDDASVDDTVQRLHELQNQAEISVIIGNGNLYYSGGMRKGIAYAKEQIKADYYALINDDVTFEAGIFDKLINNIELGDNIDVLVGAVKNSNQELSYGGIRYTRGIRYLMVGPNEEPIDTFNANCVILRKEVFLKAPNIDKAYIHSLGDFDYGLTLHKMGYLLQMAPFYVGICNDNAIEGGWRDRQLSMLERVKQKESVKGAPFRPWFHYLRKNFGIGSAIFHSITPYIRIIVGE